MIGTISALRKELCGLDNYRDVIFLVSRTAKLLLLSTIILLLSNLEVMLANFCHIAPGLAETHE